MRGWFYRPRPVRESILRLLLRQRRQRHDRERRLAILAKRPARIHPYFPDKARSPPRSKTGERATLHENRTDFAP